MRYISALTCTLLAFLLAGHALGDGTEPEDPLTCGVVYKRSLYTHWTDDDRNCRSSRTDALHRFAAGALVYKDETACVLVHGSFYDIYDASVVTAPTREVHVDHVVPLKFVHVRGGGCWSKAKRRAFANSQRNLVTTRGAHNMAKGARPPWRWMPPANPCLYVAHFAAIVKTWGVILSAYEESRLQEELARHCGPPTP